MQLLIEEMGLCDTVDPLAGSYYVETLTNQMRARMEEVMAEVDEQGGIVKMVAEGTIQSQVSAQAYRLLQDIESGEFPKVGINCYQMDEEEPEVEYHPYQEDDARRQIGRLGELREERDAALVEAALAKIDRRRQVRRQRHAGHHGGGQGLRHRGRDDRSAGLCLRPLQRTRAILKVNAKYDD